MFIKVSEGLNMFKWGLNMFIKVSDGLNMFKWVLHVYLGFRG